MDVDNITLPTTVEGLRLLIPAHETIQVDCTPKTNRDLPDYTFIGRTGYDIFAAITYEQKEAACAEISRKGPLVAPHGSPRIFAISYAPISAGLLCEVFQDIGISSVAIVAFGMKDAHYMHDIPEVPLSPDPTVTRRYDLGLNRQLPEITLFSLSEDLINDCNGKEHTMCNELGGGGGSVRYNHAVSDPHILHCHVTVYPCFLHR